jgi:cob(I)alamin adenosyltransferase
MDFTDTNYKKGYIQLYTGNGKGKTTAAMGLAFRAAGWELNTIMLQFMKGQHYGELTTVKSLPAIIIEQYGSTRFCGVDDESFNEHYTLTRQGMKRAEEVISNNQSNIVILDEIVTALYFKLVTLEEIVSLLTLKPQSMEIILTGRYAPNELIQRCDLVTEMKEIKHYYTQGVMARKGIEN